MCDCCGRYTDLEHYLTAMVTFDEEGEEWLNMMAAHECGDNPLRRVTEYFETVGWNKRLVDLTEDEVVGLIFIAKKTEGARGCLQRTLPYRII